MRGIRIYNRQDVYETVWSAPMREVAKRFGVSDVGLKKICVRLQVPTPMRGYWLRSAAERAASRRPLPPHSSGLERDEFHLRGSIVHVVDPAASAMSRAAAERSADRVTVNATLTNPHPLVMKSANLLTQAKLRDGLVSSSSRGLDIAVARASVSRALCIMDAVLKAFETRSLPIEVTAPTTEAVQGRVIAVAPITQVRVDDEWIGFSLSEGVAIAPRAPGQQLKRDAGTGERTFAPRHIQVRRVRTPTGNLSLTIHCGFRHWQWRDRKHRKLESFLNDFIAHLFIAADWTKQKRAADEEEERVRQDEARVRAEAAEREAEEQARIEDLEEMLEQWRRVRDIRELASQMRGMVHASSIKVAEGGSLHQHVAWMMGYADKIDPLRALRASLIARANADSSVSRNHCERRNG